MNDLSGQLVGDRYRVEGFVGRGGMADVYKVWDQQRAVFLAMKVLNSDLAEDAVFLRRFKREAQMLELLQHPNIVRFYGLEEWNGLAYILMDFVDGLTLRKEIYLNKKGMRPARVLQLVQPVCSALHYAHQQGMVHCDIKPANIMVHRNGTVYLADFGIARVKEGRTQAPVGAGTPAYMAPELILGREPTPAADIYALGVVIFEMLTGGERPFTGEAAETNGSTTQRIVWEKANLDAPAPSRYNHNITPELEAVTLHCLERDPEVRFGSVMDLSRLLEEAVHGEGDNYEIQTLVDIHKTANRDLSPEEIQEDQKNSDGEGFANQRVSDAEIYKQPFHSPEMPAGESFVLKPAEPAFDPPVSIQVVSAGPNQAPALPAGLLRLSTPPTGSSRKIKPTWIFSGLGMIGILALLGFFLIDRSAAGPGLQKAAAKSAAQVAAAVMPTETLAPPFPTATEIQTSSTATSQPAFPLVASATSIPPTVTPTPVPTNFGGSDGQIAFASDRSGSVQIWVMDTGSPENRRQITNQTGGACQPAWSPDGTRIAFTTPCNGPRLTYPGARIKIIDIQSGAVSDLKLQGGAFSPDWSPSGEHIAYTTYLGEKTLIYKVKLETLEVIPLSTRGTKNTDPDWSPDGEFLAFTSDDVGVDKIWIMRKDGSSQEVLTQDGAFHYFSQPEWTPDGKEIIASLKKMDSSASVQVLVRIDRSGVDGGSALISQSIRMEDGTVSPDGIWAAFWTIMDGDNMEILLADGTGTVTRLTNHKARDFHPAWKP